MQIENKYLRFAVSFIILFILHGFIGYENGNLGLISLADVAIIILVRRMKPGYGMLLAASATALAELTIGYGYYALYTAIIKGALGFTAAYLYDNMKMSYRRINLLLLASTLLKVGVDILLYGIDIILASLIAAILSFAINAFVYLLYRTFVLKRGVKGRKK